MPSRSTNPTRKMWAGRSEPRQRIRIVVTARMPATAGATTVDPWVIHQGRDGRAASARTLAGVGASSVGAGATMRQVSLRSAGFKPLVSDPGRTAPPPDLQRSCSAPGGAGDGRDLRDLVFGLDR